MIIIISRVTIDSCSYLNERNNLYLNLYLINVSTADFISSMQDMNDSVVNPCSSFHSGLATQHLFIAHDQDSQGAAANLEVKWSFPKQLDFDSAQNINGPEYTSLISQESILIVKVR